MNKKIEELRDNFINDFNPYAINPNWHTKNDEVVKRFSYRLKRLITSIEEEERERCKEEDAEIAEKTWKDKTLTDDLDIVDKYYALKDIRLFGAIIAKVIRNKEYEDNKRMA